MMPVLAAVVISVALVALIALVYLKLAFAASSVAPDDQWWEEFSLERYQPMRRLLRSDDFRFLENTPGFHPSLVRRLRRQRIEVFRAYLAEMRHDFNRLEAVGRAMAFASNAPANLHNEIFHQKLRFTRTWWLVRLELVAYRFGLGTVDAGALVDSLTASARIFHPALQPSM